MRSLSYRNLRMGGDQTAAPFLARRECGMSIELDDVPVRSLVPEQLQACKTAEEYMQRLPEFDEEMTKLQEEAAAAGECLRYVGE